MTLLFAFFVVMYASSQVDRSKMARLAAAIGGAFTDMSLLQGTRTSAPVVVREDRQAAAINRAQPATTRVDASVTSGMNPVVLEALRRDLESALGKEIQTGSITLRAGHDGLIVSLSEVGFFDSGSAKLRSDAAPTFVRVANVLTKRTNAVRIEGHTDNVPIRTREFESNWELSTARATGLLKVLISDHNFAPALLSAAGYGEFHPVADNSTTEGRRLNRRVDLVILAPEKSATSREPAAHRVRVAAASTTSEAGSD